MLYPQKPPSETAINRRLSELCGADLIEIYAGTDGKPYLKLKSWEQHQRRRADKSKFPDPKPDSLSVAVNCCQLLSNVAVNDNVNDNVNVNDILTHACACEESDVSGKKSSEKEQPKPIDCASGSIDGAAPIDCAPRAVTFEEFWELYPRKIAKSDAQKAWQKLKPTEELSKAIFSAIDSWKKSQQWQKDGGEFIPYPATFLRKRMWESEVVPNKPKKQEADKYQSESYDFDQFLAAAQKRGVK
jgi:hypothetical protein